MVVAASTDRSFEARLMVDGLSPVRLTHPIGDSYVNQPNGPFVDGYVSGSSRCHECRQRDGAKAERIAAKRASAKSARIEKAKAALNTASDPLEIAGLLRSAGHDVAGGLCRHAWKRLAQSGVMPCDYEIVRVRCWRSMFKDHFQVEERQKAWYWNDTQSRSGDGLIDSTGAIWKIRNPTPSGFLTERGTNTLFLKPGEAIRLKARTAPGARSWTPLTGDIRIEHGESDRLADAVLSVVDRMDAFSQS
jgi:hypothetical protein